MRLRYTLGIVLLAVLNVAFSQSQQQSAAPEPSQAGSLDVVANSVTNLAQKISLAIASPKSKTEIFSPVSIAGALSLLLLGSVGNTQTELMNLMGFKDADISFTDIHKSFGKLFRELVSNEPNLKANVPWRENDKCNNYDDDDEEPDTRGSHSKRDTSQPTDFDRYSHEIQLANGIFLDDNFNLNPTYKKLAQDVYASEVEKLSFAAQPVDATKRINEWINQNTHGKIPEIFPTPVGSNTAMVIASALYFKALWEDMFIDGATRPRDFFPNGRNNSAIKIDMMAHGGCFPYYDSPELDARILGIPYKNKLTTMYVIKPNDSNRRSLQELIAKLNSVAVNEMIKRMKRKTALILFPKMHLSGTTNLKKVLKILGVRSLFSAQKSELSVISGDSTPIAVNSVEPVNPAVNLPFYSNKKKPAVNKDKLIFSRFENETTISGQTLTTSGQMMADETYATETMLPPTTIEGDMTAETDLPTTTLPSTVQKKGKRIVRDVSYKTPTDGKGKPEPLNSKDFFLNKRIVKPTPGKKSHRSRRASESLYVSDAIHKVDLEINERGTEGGAATAISLNRSGTNVVFRADEPFLLIVINDKTKVPLFFGAIYDPSA